MLTLLSISVLGFFLGMRHATDADHVIAVSTIVCRERSVKRAALIGIFWGLGHTLTILIVGSAIILFGLVIPPRLGLAFELAVGVVLIFLGILNLAGVRRLPTHTHPHQQRSEESGPAEHAKIMDWTDGLFARLRLYQTLRPMLVGIVHGLAGSAGIALIVLATIKAPLGAVAYLLVFGIGTIAGMMLITTAVAVPLSISNGRFRSWNGGLGIASGLLSLSFGMFVVYQITVVQGFFGASPVWIPR